MATEVAETCSSALYTKTSACFVRELVYICVIFFRQSVISGIFSASDNFELF